MALPNVYIPILNGQIGASEDVGDGYFGLIMSGVAVADKIALLEPKQITSVEDAEDLGLDAAYDTANSVKVNKHIRDFYADAPNGQPLIIMLVVNSTTMANICDKNNDIAKKLVNFATLNDSYGVVAVTREPDGAYEPTYVEGLDDDVIAAITNLNALADDMMLQFKPFVGLVEGRDYQGVTGDIYDLRGAAFKWAAGVLANNAATTGASVASVLGRLAKFNIQESIAKVKNGPIGWLKAYLSDGEELVEPDGTVNHSETELGQLHDKGWIVPRKFQGKSGFYFSDDPTATALTDDYNSIAKARVIQKAYVIAYATYVNELSDDLEVDENGFVDPAILKSYQAKIENAILDNMANNISSVKCEIDPKQAILATNKVKIKKLGITPRGYAKEIEVPLGFTNPALNS